MRHMILILNFKFHFVPDQRYRPPTMQIDLYLTPQKHNINKFCSLVSDEGVY